MLLHMVALLSPALPRYLDATAPVPARVADLLAHMTMEEKVEQLVAINHSPFAWSGGHYFGSIKAAERGVEQRNKYQAAAINASRLHIPVQFFHESLHGGCMGASIFPMPLTLAASWNASLVRTVYRAVAAATRGCGASIAFAPVINLFTDPRFGRFQEGFSPDPTLSAHFATASVDGLQGSVTGNASTYLPDAATSVVALGKHFAGYGGGIGGLNGAPLLASELELRDVFLRPWRAFAAAGGRGAMPAHQTVLGVPCHANDWLVNTVLRSEYGFGEGLTISDCNDISVLINFRVASNVSHAAARGLVGGVDVDLQCPHAAYTPKAIEAALAAGLVSQAKLDAAVRHVLTAKFAARLFETPYLDPKLPSQSFDTKANRKVAYDAAAQGLVLLKNQDGALPLTVGADGASPLRVSVLGELGCDAQAARQALLGSYVSDDGNISVPSIFDAALARGGFGNLKCAVGASPDAPANASAIAAASAVASEADVIIVVAGDSKRTCGEWKDRDDLDLPGGQMELLAAATHAARRTGSAAPAAKVILVLVNGRPATFGAATGNVLLDAVDALIWAGRPGEEGSNALVDVLTGALTPSGKLQANWPRSVNQVGSGSTPFLQPITGKWVANARGVADPDGRRYDAYEYDINDPTPLFRFGEGLSYTTFEFTAITVEPASSRCRSGGQSVIAHVHFTLANTGSWDGAEVAQVYIQDPAGASVVVRPWKRLVGFDKVWLAAGASLKVAIDLTFDDLALHDEAMQLRIAPGEYKVSVGGSSATDSLSTVVDLSIADC